MKRSEFLRACSILGISIPFSPLINGCASSEISTDPISFNDKVLIIGAGAAGMSAGYLLAQQGIEFEILEAKSTYGGRIKHTRNFADFPIPLGGEWVHVASSILQEAVNDSSVQITTQTQGYSVNDQQAYFDGNNLTYSSLGTDGAGIDQKFINSSWLDFFETYILPSVQSKIIYDTPVVNINYSGSQINATALDGTNYSADRVIVTVPLKILQNNVISFTPDLPSSKQSAIQNLTVWSGFKAFFKFNTKFYPTFLSFPDSETNAGQRLYYDASYAQNSQQHILGLFSVGQQAEVYQNYSGEALRDYILAELDSVFGSSIATNSYIDHITQNWNEEPYINAAYITDNENWQLVSTLGNSVNNKLYFAGDGYTDGEDWGSVHTAIRAARRVVSELLG